MQLIQYLESVNNKYIDKRILNDHKQFDYDNYNDFKLVLTFLMTNIYNKSFYDLTDARIEQDKFRKLIKDKYKNCIIKGSISEECEAAHIMEINNGGNYDIDNGILLDSSLHKTFDKYFWCINPYTLLIEVKENINVGSIYQYKNKKINLELNEKMKYNLIIRYNLYTNK